MDGVVADFDEYAFRKVGAPPSAGVYPNDIWKQLAENHRIYRDLNKTPYADELVFQCSVFARQNNFLLRFLTAVPKDNDMPWSFHDKMNWAQIWFPSIPVFFGPYSKDKHHHCKKGDILIDDRISNIEEWNAAGGIGILHKGDYKMTLTELYKHENITDRI